jgi:hypothetical protein
MPNRSGFDRSSGGGSFSQNLESSLGSILSLRPQAKYMTGARTIIRVNGDIVAFAFQVAWSVRTEATEINTIDDPLPWELAPKRIEVTGTLGMFQVPGQSPQAMTIQSDVGSFLMNRYITIEVKDSSTDAVIFRAGSAMITGQQSELSYDQIGRTTLTWKAVGWQTENPPKIPSDQSDEEVKSSLDKASDYIKNGIDNIKSKITSF